MFNTRSNAPSNLDIKNMGFQLGCFARPKLFFQILEKSLLMPNAFALHKDKNQPVFTACFDAKHRKKVFERLWVAFKRSIAQCNFAV